MIQGEQQFISSLNNTKEYVLKENNDIIYNQKFFEELIHLMNNVLMLLNQYF